MTYQSEDGASSSCFICCTRSRRYKYKIDPAVDYHWYNNGRQKIPSASSTPPNGRQFCRSNTLAVISVSNTICKQEIQQLYSGKNLLDIKPDPVKETPRSCPGQRKSIMAVPTESAEKVSCKRSPLLSIKVLSVLQKSPLKRRKTSWDCLECPKKNEKNDEIESNKRLSSASDKCPPSWTHGPSTPVLPKDNSQQLDGDGSFTRKKYRLPHFTNRPSVREKPTNTETRRKALRQRSMSLDAGEELWSAAAAAAAAAAGEEARDRSPSLTTSPSFSETIKKRGSASADAREKTSRQSGSSLRWNKITHQKDSGNKKKKPATSLTDLFHAVEKQDISRIRQILEENSPIDINSTNSDELTSLDVAVLINHIPLAQLLLSYGARENAKFQKSSEDLRKKLQSLNSTSKTKVAELRRSMGQSKENESLLKQWEEREKMFNRMIIVFENAKPPTEPISVVLSVCSSSSLLVTFEEPLQHNGGIVTRYKVEWSCFQSFLPLIGEQIIEDPQHKLYEVINLVHANVYHVRVSAANFKGFGTHALSNPPFAIPSNWKEVDDFKSRWDGKPRLLNELFTNIKNSRPRDAPQIEGEENPTNRGTSLNLPGRKSFVKSLRFGLFLSSPKFQKTLKRGVYLASLISCDDQILVTNEEIIPIVLVDENFLPNNLHTDYYWLMKIACTWKDVQSLRLDLEKSSSPGTTFRCRLLQAITNLQSAIGVKDLGQFYHQPIKDANGTIILIAVRNLQSTKNFGTTQLMKWVPLGKVQRRCASAIEVETSALDMLFDLTQEFIKYQRYNNTLLTKGLYLGYLKLQSSVDRIHIMVPQQMPNVLPSVKIRNCPNVTREEWEWIKCLNRNDIRPSPSPSQLQFQTLLIDACKKLLLNLKIAEAETVIHRLYDVEVIELTSDVSLILVLPNANNVCAVPGHTEVINPGCIVLPVQVFEMAHMRAYQFDFMSLYSRLSSILEIDLHLAQQASRQAFYSDELTSANRRLSQLGHFQQKLDEAWKSTRWTMDIITYARDKSLNAGLPLGVLFASSPRRRPTPPVAWMHTDGTSSTSSDCGYHSDRSSTTESQITGNTSTSRSTDRRHESRAQTFIDDCEKKTLKPGTQSGSLRVYSVYSTGLGKGTSVKLHVTPDITAKEIVVLVIEQLSKASFRQLPTETDSFPEDNADNFCLVLSVASREHILRDDFQPLQLQNPWTRGRLLVQIKPNCQMTKEDASKRE